jgi:hypothetical protein
MSLIAQIAGIWYSCLSPITVPGGVSNAQVLLQLNDATIGDNQGEYACDVCVTNNQAAVWSHILVFALNKYGFTITSQSGGTQPINGLWTPGVGFQARRVTGTTNEFTFLQIKQIFSASFTMTAAAIKYTQVLGTNGGAGTLSNAIYYYDAAGVLHLITSNAPATGTNQTLSWLGSQLVSGLLISNWVGDEPLGTNPGGSDTLIQLSISGVGVDPFAAF